MALPLPNLDSRRWADLVEEGRALLPRYAPRWTDHNVHDPGITLIELLAWLVEQDIYRVNQISDRHRRKFLDLVGFSPEGPRAARAVLSFAPDPGTLPFDLLAGTEFEATIESGQAGFRTLRDVTVADVALAAIQVDVGDGTLHDRTLEWRDGVGVAPMGRAPVPGAALYLGFSAVPTTVPVTLAVHVDDGGDRDERERILAEWESAAPVPHHSVRLAWEVFVVPGVWTPLTPVSGLARPGPGEVMDDTRALTLDGIVEVNLPLAVQPVAVGAVATALVYVRCRLTEGAYDARPLVLDVVPNGVEVEQAVPASERLVIAAGVNPTGPAPAPGTATRLSLAIDARGVVHSLAFDPGAPGAPDITVLDYVAPAPATDGHLTLDARVLGVGSGKPGQTLALPEAPIQVESLHLVSHAAGGWQTWRRRHDLDASRRADADYILDPTAGIVRFGDGEHGRPLPAGAALAALYRTTRGAAGNVGARAITRPAASARNAVALAGVPAAAHVQLARITTNRRGARDGRDAEPVAHASGRAVEVLYAHERLLDAAGGAGHVTLDQMGRERVRALPAPTRAITVLDIERLAFDVPGTRIARARAWAGVHPVLAGLRAPGTITVVIVPDLAVPRPQPSAGLLAAVRRSLDRRRLVCMRVEVVGPRYLAVGVDARIVVHPLADPTRVTAAVASALDAFLDPRRGGPEGRGWPFGRDVYRTEVLQTIHAVPGVDHVETVTLVGEGVEPTCGNVRVCPTWLVTAGAHRLVAERRR